MTALQRALSDPPLRPLPPEAAGLLRDLDAPPRPAAHLRAVHDAACEILTWLTARHPEVAVDGDAVRHGAATHDIGKCPHPGELTGPARRTNAPATASCRPGASRSGRPASPAPTLHGPRRAQRWRTTWSAWPTRCGRRSASPAWSGWSSTGRPAREAGP
ncbi:hypothetical protein ACIBP6_13330 [Nonomuraea terrae]|uniref:hypothetical protein n=1 Tax=Nonomuraea terrae TaxID=2530383 RepID=UPI0037A2247E